jgi:Ubiquitin elongating factor core
MFLFFHSEALVDMLQSDLLSPDTAQALCASRPFLLGIASSLLQMCSINLSTRLSEEGFDAFDYRYFVKEGEKGTGIIIPSQERCLIDMDTTSGGGRKIAERPSRFAGATEFFFLTAGLLRVSLFPGFRVSEEFQSMLRSVFASIQQLSSQQPSVDQLRRIRPDSMEQMQKCTSVAQGWSTFVDDPDISPLITAFSLMQLQWVSQAANTDALAFIPEWFVKLPSQWLARKYSLLLFFLKKLFGAG